MKYDQTNVFLPRRDCAANQRQLSHISRTLILDCSTTDAITLKKRSIEHKFRVFEQYVLEKKRISLYQYAGRPAHAVSRCQSFQFNFEPTVLLVVFAYSLNSALVMRTFRAVPGDTILPVPKF